MLIVKQILNVKKKKKAYFNLGNTTQNLERSPTDSAVKQSTVPQRYARGKIWPHFRPSGKAVMVLNKDTAL